MVGLIGGTQIINTGSSFSDRMSCFIFLVGFLLDFDQLDVRTGIW